MSRKLAASEDENPNKRFGVSCSLQESLGRSLGKLTNVTFAAGVVDVIGMGFRKLTALTNLSLDGCCLVSFGMIPSPSIEERMRAGSAAFFLEARVPFLYNDGLHESPALEHEGYYMECVDNWSR